MKKLLLLRHAKSDWAVSVRDLKRPLKNRGRRDAQRIGVWLAQQSLIPEHVISSYAERTRSTAQKVLKSMGKTAEHIEYRRGLYMSSIEEHFDIIRNVPKDTKVLLLVGHNPALEELLIDLSASKIEFEGKKLLPTATLAILEFKGCWRELISKHCELKAIIKPKKLPRTYPYPLENSQEQRIRPAYYYNQSGVIPYRFISNELQILVITSSQNTHYVLPKGIKEPGMTPEASAEKEAFEEAGIKGIVDSKKIGSFQFEKWKALCTVSVYPMLVTEILSKQDWEETYRTRTWLPVKEAIKKLQQEAYKGMILKLAKTL